MKHSSLLVRFSIVGFAAIVLVCLLFTWGGMRLAHQLSDDFVQEDMAGLEQQFVTKIDSMLGQSKLAVDTIAALPEVQKAVARRNKQVLAKLFDSQWPEIKASGVRQFQFHFPPAYSLYRVHKPNKSGDDLSSFRKTVVDVNTNHKPVAGIEKGVAGIGLRYVSAVSYDGKHVGSVEFGMALTRQTFSKILKDKSIDMAIYLYQSSGQLQPVVKPVLKNVLTLAPRDYEKVLSGQSLNFIAISSGHDIAIRAFPLRDYSGKVVGVVEMSHDISQLQSDIWSGVKWMLCFGLLSSLLALFVFIWLVRRSMVPIYELIDSMNNMVDGQQGLGARLEQKGAREVELLTHAFNRFCVKLQSTFGEISDSVNHMAARSATLSAESVAADKGMTRQKDEISQISSAMTQMTETVHDVANNISQAAQAAEVTNDKAQAGGEIVNKAINRIQKLAESIEHTGELSSKVHEASTAIASILEVIQAISEQTNLLALNAAIEAARAGDQGRGFAVVANEVRNLAQRTQTSTEEIRQKISALESSVSQTVGVIEVSQEQAEKSVSEIRSAGQGLADIEQSVIHIRDMSAQIATASEQQTHVSDEINNNIIRINDSSEISANAALQTAKLSAQIAKDIEQLSETFSTFVSDDSDLQMLMRAKTAHLAWKTKIRSYLSGLTQMSIEEATSSRDCSFGKWYYSVGQQKFSGISAIDAIELPHAELHKAIQDIIRAKESGDLVKAEALYEKIEEYSTQVVSLLDELMDNMS